MGFIKWITDGLVSIGQVITSGIKRLFGIKPKPPTEKIRAAIRKQWLELEPTEEDIPGVEWEGEVYYTTPK
jgi:hypothetical protein